MAINSLGDWFSCPRCGDDGSVQCAQVFKEVSVKFTCEADDHRLEDPSFRRFSRESRVTPDPNTMFEVIEWTVNNTETLFLAKNIAECISCPHCGSQDADMGIEPLIVEYNYREHLYPTFTVWCNDCEAVERDWMDNYDDHSGKVDISKDTLVEASNFPPSYLDE